MKARVPDSLSIPPTKPMIVLFLLAAISVHGATHPEPLLPRETAGRLRADMPLPTIDSILQGTVVAKRYEFAVDGRRYVVRRYNQFQSAYLFVAAERDGGRGGERGGATNVLPYFVITGTAPREVVALGTHRAIMDACPPGQRKLLSTMFEYVVRRDTSEFARLDFDASMRFLHAHLNQWPPVLGDDPLSRRIPAVLDRVESTLDAGIRRDPNNALYRMRMGDVYRMRANLVPSEANRTLAEKFLREAVALDSVGGEAQYLLGSMYFSPDDSSARKAEPWFASARRNGRGGIKHRALWGLSLCAWVRGRKDLALGYAQDYLREEPGDQATTFLRDLVERDIAGAPKPGP